MRHGFIAPALLALGMVAAAGAPLQAQCDGMAGWSLDAPDTVGLGEGVDVTLDGPVNDMALLLVSLGQGPVKSPYGTICLDFPVAAAIPVMLDATGHAVVSGDIPCDPVFIDLTFYLQFLTCSIKGSSNQEALLIADSLHAGALCTYTQHTWGANCSGTNVGCLLANEFDNVFPTGIIIGDVDGPGDGDQVWGSCWGSAAALNVFLPIGGSPGLLVADTIDPVILNPACIFSGNLLASKLNVGFDLAGQFDAGKCRDDLKLGDMVFVGGVDADLIGWSVNDLIVLCDTVISGELGGGPYDITGDAIADVTIKDLNNALDALNRNFENCTTDLGYLAAP